MGLSNGPSRGMRIRQNRLGPNPTQSILQEAAKATEVDPESIPIDQHRLYVPVLVELGWKIRMEGRWPAIGPGNADMLTF